MTLNVGLKIRTSIPLARIEAWLSRQCKGEWHITLEDISSSLTQKSISIYFERTVDREAFKSAYKTFK